MKKLLSVLVIIALVALGWHFYQKNEAATPEVKVPAATTRPNPSNATFQFEDGPVTLSGGSSGEVTLSDDIAYGDVNADGKNDTAVILVQSGAGSGIFVYVAVYSSGNVTYKGSNAVFLGDRVDPEKIVINKDGSIDVTYLDRRPDEPMAADPTVRVTKSFVFRNSELEEK